MPFLRFSRDKRGYETTSLIYAGRRQSPSRHRILYWFRTPPGVKVGRPALDEAAIRWIEEHNPDIDFDWPRILEAKPPAALPPDERRLRKGRRDKPERRRPSPAAATAAVSAPAAVVEAQEDRVASENRVASEDELAEALQQLARSDAEEEIAVPAMPVEQAIGPEDLTRLRARYAELLARIAERGGDAARIDALRAEAEALNPDAWVTEEETRRGIAAFEPKLRELRAALGLRRRRRSRRGGRRRSAAPRLQNSEEG